MELWRIELAKTVYVLGSYKGSEAHYVYRQKEDGYMTNYTPPCDHQWLYI